MADLDIAALRKLLDDYRDGATVQRLDAEVEAIRAERDALRAQRDGLLALVERASTDSVVTTADDPGCFYCDHVEHTKRCPAAAAIRAAKGRP